MFFFPSATIFETTLLAIPELSADFADSRRFSEDAAQRRRYRIGGRKTAANSNQRSKQSAEICEICG
jgi:hypothetical protein